MAVTCRDAAVPAFMSGTRPSPDSVRNTHRGLDRPGIAEELRTRALNALSEVVAPRPEDFGPAFQQIGALVRLT